MMKTQTGQGMTEYIIIVALIAVTAIGVYSFFGKTIRNQVAGLSNEMSGQGADSAIDAAHSAATTANAMANNNYTLGSYSQGANGAARDAASNGSDTSKPDL